MDIILIIVTLLITIGAQTYVSTSYNKYKKIKNHKNTTGFEVAREILDKHGLNNVYVTETKGVLSDHYDSSRKVIRLSTEVFHGTSIASCSIAAHEVGHAIQDKEKYSFMQFRSMMFPIVNFSSYAGYLAILIGILFSSMQMIWVGIGLEFIILIFQFVTLPVELDASKRALVELRENRILKKDELAGSQNMLNAAAFTYIASVLNTILQILRLIFIFGDSDKG